MKNLLTSAVNGGDLLSFRPGLRPGSRITLPHADSHEEGYTSSPFSSPLASGPKGRLVLLLN